MYFVQFSLTINFFNYIISTDNSSLKPSYSTEKSIKNIAE